MQEILKTTQHNLAKLYNPYKVSQCLAMKMSTLFKQSGISKDLRYHLLISYFIKAIKSIEPRKHAEVCNLYKQVISLLKTLGRKRIYTHYQDNVNIRSQNKTRQAVRMENRQVAEYRRNNDNNQLYQAIEMQRSEIGKLLYRKNPVIMHGSGKIGESEQKINRRCEELSEQDLTQLGLEQQLSTRSEGPDELEQKISLTAKNEIEMLKNEKQKEIITQLKQELDVKNEEVNELQYQVEQRNKLRQKLNIEKQKIREKDNQIFALQQEINKQGKELDKLNQELYMKDQDIKKKYKK